MSTDIVFSNLSIIYIFKMNIKTNLIEDYVNFVDTTTKQSTYFKKILILFAIITSLFLIFLLCKYLNEYYHFFRTNFPNNNLDYNLTLLRNKLDLMGRFMKIKSVNPKLKQDQIGKELDWSSSTLQRFRNDINMVSPYRIPPNIQKNTSNTNLDYISNSEHDVKTLQTTSKNLKRPQTNSKESSPTIETVKPDTSKKTKLKGGTLKENHEYNEYSDEILHNKNSYIE